MAGQQPVHQGIACKKSHVHNNAPFVGITELFFGCPEEGRIFETEPRIVHQGHREVVEMLGGARIESRPDSSRYVDLTIVLGVGWRPPAQPFYP